MLGVGDARRRVMVELRRLVAAQGGDDAGEDDRQPVAARVDDAGLAQRGQQLGTALDRVLAGRDRALERLGRWPRPARCGSVVGPEARVLRAVGDVGDDLVGHLPRHGQDRALGRLAHRGVGAVGRVRERRADQRRVDQLAGPRDELLGRAADQLGEDHAGVPPRAQQRGARHRLHDLLAPDLIDRALPVGALQPIELVEHGAQRERHVVARVAVGDGEHVEVVDLLAPRFQVRERPRDGDAKAQEIGIGHDDTSITFAKRSSIGAAPPRTGLDGWRRCPQRAFVTLPAFRQRVHTYTRLGALPTRILHLLQVRIKAPLGRDHRVAAALAERRPLAAAVTYLGHRGAAV